jgi:beta-lactamase regulating signal transducer with metallopeptidase domain
MILPYLSRLLCLCFASFFVLNFGLGLLVRLFSKSAVRFAESRTAGAAAGLLFSLRLLPYALANFFVLLLSVPSYLWLEPAATSERVGVLCIALGLVGAATWLLAIERTGRALFVSLRRRWLCRSSNQETGVSDKSLPVIVIEDEAPVLALSGLLRPSLLISRGVFRALSTEELDAALRHECAHRTSRDNVKRLLMLLAPDVLPFFSPLRILERTWSKFAEWAADDQASAGDSSRAVSLAAALVHVARMGTASHLPYLSTSLLACDRDLSARVNRLLQSVPNVPVAAKPAPHHRMRTAAFLIAACLATVVLVPFALSSVHELLELLLH